MVKKVKEIAIFESCVDGHRFTLYVKCVVEQAISNGWSVEIYTKNKNKGREELDRISSFAQEDIKFHYIKSVGNKKLCALFWFLGVLYALRKKKHCLCVFTSYEKDALFLLICAMLTDRRWVALSIRPKVTGFNAKRLVRLVLPWLTMALSTNARILRLDNSNGDTKETFRDPIIQLKAIDTGTCSKKVSAHNSFISIAAFGALTPRKNIKNLVLASEQMNRGRSQPKVRLTIAGLLRDQELQKELIRLEQEDWLTVENKLISDECATILLSESRYSWVAYDRTFEGYSGVLPLSCACNAIPIGMSETLVGNLIREMHLGYVGNLTCSIEVEHFLNSLWRKRHAEATKESKMREACKLYAQQFSAEKFFNAISGEGLE